MDGHRHLSLTPFRSYHRVDARDERAERDSAAPHIINGHPSTSGMRLPSALLTAHDRGQAARTEHPCHEEEEPLEHVDPLPTALPCHSARSKRRYSAETHQNGVKKRP